MRKSNESFIGRDSEGGMCMSNVRKCGRNVYAPEGLVGEFTCGYYDIGVLCNCYCILCEGRGAS